jgi:hypothetical protein
MLIIETLADGANVGKMVCRWDEGAALMAVRRVIEKAYRALDERRIRPGAPGADETEIQGALDDWSAIARAMFEKYAPEVFYIAQSQPVSDVAMKLLQEAIRRDRHQ